MQAVASNVAWRAEIGCTDKGTVPFMQACSAAPAGWPRGDRERSADDADSLGRRWTRASGHFLAFGINAIAGLKGTRLAAILHRLSMRRANREECSLAGRRPAWSPAWSLADVSEKRTSETEVQAGFPAVDGHVLTG